MTALADLVSVMAFDPLDGLLSLEEQLAWMKREAAARGWPFDRHAVRNELQAATFRLRDARQVRLLLGPTGAVAIEISPVM